MVVRLGVIVAVLAVLLAVGFVDHRHTLKVSARASADSWWCTHKSVRCTGFDARAYHDRWELRERGYEVGSAVLTAAAALVGAGGLRLRLRTRRYSKSDGSPGSAKARRAAPSR
ncbi:MAG: hypothetical protein QOH95_2853 [Gaiellaceae bacterium]|nr:hypothetical protein [Gaiellaceae bacterium]